MLTLSNVAADVRQFITSNFLYGQEHSFTDEASFMDNGIVDSTGVLQLIEFLQETYGITVTDEELVPENFDSVTNVASYLVRKTGGAARVSGSSAGGNADAHSTLHHASAYQGTPVSK